MRKCLWLVLGVLHVYQEFAADAEPIRFVNRHIRSTVMYSQIDQLYWLKGYIYMPEEAVNLWFKEVVREIVNGRNQVPLSPAQNETLYGWFMALLNIDETISTSDNNPAISPLFWPSELPRPTAKIGRINEIFRGAPTPCIQAAIVANFTGRKPPGGFLEPAGNDIYIGVGSVPQTDYCYLPEFLKRKSGLDPIEHTEPEFTPPNIPSTQVNSYLTTFNQEDPRRHASFDATTNEFKARDITIFHVSLLHIRTMVQYAVID